MKALSLTQPWATLVALDLKRIETRSWYTNYRGPIVIHAAKGFPAAARAFADELIADGRLPGPLPLGVVLCVRNLKDCRRTEALVHDPLLTPLERGYGDYSAGRYGWLFDPVEHVFNPPIPARGALGLWDWNAPASPHYDVTNPQLSLLEG